MGMSLLLDMLLVVDETLFFVQENILHQKRLARVNLSDHSVSYEKIPEDVRRKFLGGRGLNIILLYQILSEIDEISAFHPSTPLIFGTGILTGTGAPSSSRMNITTISPESRVFCDTNMGGFFPAHLRFAGIDTLVITGRSPEPVYLYVENGKIEIHSADFLWGKGTVETQRLLKEKHGEYVEIACIGPAGENKVRFACIINNRKNAAGRGGSGAVMGFKNLKAIVAGDGKGIPIFRPLEFLELVQELNKYLASSKIIKTLGKYGTPLLYDVSNMLGAIRTKNSQLNAFSDDLRAEKFHEFVERMVSCYGCVVHCRHRNTVSEKDVVSGEGPEYSTLGFLGANIGISNPREVIILNNMVNDLGLDASSTGSVLAWMFELYERGMITKDQTGMELGFGNFELTKELLYQISHRIGFGDVIAEGRHAAVKLGVSEELLIAVKGLPQSDPHDVRYIKSFALGIATATRGADHLRSRPTLDILLSIPSDVIDRIYGAKIDRNPTSYETKEYMVYFSENIYAVEDCLGLCRFVCHGFNSPHLLNYTHFAKLLKLATGLEYSERELEKIGCNVIDLERWINYKFFNIGFESDTLPKRYFDDPMPIAGKPTSGHRIDREQFQKMLHNYYKLRGWLKDDGSLELKNPITQEIVRYENKS